CRICVSPIETDMESQKSLLLPNRIVSESITMTAFYIQINVWTLSSLSRSGGQKSRNLVARSNVFGFLESKCIRSHQTRSAFGGSMIFRRSLLAAAIVVAVTSLLPMFVPTMAVQTTGLPAEISDKDFWRMIVDLSEPGGT